MGQGGDNAGGGADTGNRRVVDDSGGCDGGEGVSVVRKDCAVAAGLIPEFHLSKAIPCLSDAETEGNPTSELN